jgi:hypothetical protein
MDMRPSYRKIVHRYPRVLCLCGTGDDLNLRGKPEVVAWKEDRSIVCAASYGASEGRCAFGDVFAIDLNKLHAAARGGVSNPETATDQFSPSKQHRQRLEAVMKLEPS